jgi:small-conductance mechanosensitive channel
MAPNSLLWNVPVTNYSRQQERRNDLTIGIGYEDDIEKAQSVMLELARKDRPKGAWRIRRTRMCSWPSSATAPCR